MQPANILLVDDDDDTRLLLAEALGRRGYRVHDVNSGTACLEYLRENVVDVVVTDVQMPGLSGIALCGELHLRHPDILTIVLTGVGNLDSAIAAIRAGAHDFLTKPAKLEVLEIAIKRALDHTQVKREVHRLREAVGVTTPIPGLIGSSSSLREVATLVRRVAPSDATVLITGESGTGKEVIARALHTLSPRKDQPFVAINCGAMPAPLLESELFGHVRGAFTDAKQSRAGLFLQAGAGTIFLDEVGEMPLELQAKLLRVLQERTVRPVGGNDEQPFQARVITATNRDLTTEVEEKRFREDLFHRINVVEVSVPPLRDRAGDVAVLAKHMLERVSQRTGKPLLTLDPDATRKLVNYNWPGNVRELENCIERAVALCGPGPITTSHLPTKVQNYEPARFELSVSDPTVMTTLDEMERRYVRQVLDAVNGNKTHAARVLGIDRRSLYRRLESPRSPATS